MPSVPPLQRHPNALSFRCSLADFQIEKKIDHGHDLVPVRRCGDSTDGSAVEQEGSPEAAAFGLRPGGVKGGTPGPGNGMCKGMGCASSSQPQKPLSEKLPKAAWLRGWGQCKESSVPEALRVLDKEAKEAQNTAETRKEADQLRARKRTPSARLRPSLSLGPPRLPLCLSF